MEKVKNGKRNSYRFENANIWLCAANYQTLFKPAENYRSAGAWKQVFRSGTSIGAHYREGHRAKSDADIINKFETALQELDETDYWLELLVKAGIIPTQKAAPLRKETNELLAIFTTIVTKIKKRMGRI